MDQFEYTRSSYKWYYNALSVIRIIAGTCWMSLMIILLIVALLLLLEQGGTIIIDLLGDPLSLCFTVILFNSMALAIGHYPVYILKWKRENNLYNPITQSSSGEDCAEGKKTVWKMHYSVFGLGFITYKDPCPSNFKNKRAFDYARGFISIALLIAFMYVLLFLYRKYITPELNLQLYLWSITLLSLALYTFLFFNEEKIKNEWKDIGLSVTGLCFWTSFSLFLYCIWMSFTRDGIWNAKVYIGLLLLYTFTILTYILFKTYRTLLDQKKWLFPLSVLKEHKNYILMLGIVGFMSFCIILFSHVYPFLFNPLVIILAAFYLLYGMIIIVLKHRFYYKYVSQERISHSTFMRNVFVYFAPLAPVLLLVWAYFAGSDGNNLHALKQIEKQEVMKMESYKQHLYTTFADQTNEEKKLYFIASYGGGLKANAWNMMVLDTLSNFNGRNILASTIAMSGVSGGALGQAFYAGLSKNYTNADSIREKIDLISNGNFLSVDLSWLLGRDLIQEFCFWDGEIKKDRAKKVMQLYAEKIGDQSMVSMDYQSYWKELFDEKEHYPLLITNASGINQKRGIACAVSTNKFDRVFPHADNILDLKSDKSLAYLHAVSCAHRFPIFSPAAKIEGKGHYLDGGYFENSGMLSLLNMYEYLKRDTSWNRHFGSYEIIFIQIRNSKSAYIRKKIRQLSKKVSLQEIKETGELMAILKTISSIDFIPRYLESEMRQNPQIHYATIDLPYKFDKEDVYSYFKAEKFDEVIEPLVDSLIDSNAAYLDQVLYNKGYTRWNIAEPPLARLLSQAAVNYMHQVLRNDSTVFATLK